MTALQCARRLGSLICAVVVYSMLPSTLNCANMNCFSKPFKAQPAATILPSGWSATSVKAAALNPRSEVTRPPEPNDVCGLPSGLKTATAKDL